MVYQKNKNTEVNGMNEKKSICKKVGCFILAVFTFITSSSVSVKAEAYWPEGPEIQTPSAIVMEVNSGAVLYEKNSDAKNYPASITKILTTLVALEQSALDETVTFSADAVYKNEGDTSHIARDLGEEMTMEQTLYAVMLESANECAYAAAEHVGAKLGGNYQTFVDLMNERAKKLGCENTHFNNANGLPDEQHWTTARDMAKISVEAYKNEMFRTITGTKTYQIPPTNKHSGITYLNNHHAMLHYYRTNQYLYDYCTGGKTGYTVVAGATLVTFAEKDELSLVCVVMNTDNTSQYLDTTALLEYCFQNFKSYPISENNTAIANKNMGIMNNNESYVTFHKEASVILPITASFEEAEYELVENTTGGSSVAQLRYSYAGRDVGTVDIVLSNACVNDSYFDIAKIVEEQEVDIVKIKLSTIFALIIGLIGFIILIVVGKKIYDNYYFLINDYRYKKERRNRFRAIEKKKRRRRKKDSMFR